MSRVLAESDAPVHRCEALLELFSVPSHRQGLGPARVREIIVNVVAPFCAAVALRSDDRTLLRASIVLYHQCSPAPENRVVQKLARVFGLTAPFSAGCQQGLLELHHEYCTQFRCGSCLIGRQKLVS